MKTLRGEIVTKDDRPAKIAFRALMLGEATDGQQKLCLKMILALGDPLGAAPAEAGERLVGMIDGARWLAKQIADLTGGGVPHATETGETND